MIVVMPLGYGTMEIITLGWGAWSHTDVRDKNFSRFREALLILSHAKGRKGNMTSPKIAVRARLRASPWAGLETLLTGLNNLDKFAWVGGIQLRRFA